MNTVELRKWIEDNDIIGRTMEGFWESFNDEFFSEGARLLKEDKLIVAIDEIAMKLKDYNKQFKGELTEEIEVRLGLYYLDLYMGCYSHSYDLSGRLAGNGLEWGLAFAAINQRLSILEDLRNEFESALSSEEADINNNYVVLGLIDEKIAQIKQAFEGKQAK